MEEHDSIHLPTKVDLAAAKDLDRQLAEAVSRKTWTPRWIASGMTRPWS